MQRDKYNNVKGCNLHIYTHVNDFYRPGQWSHIAIVVTVTIYYIANIQ